ncbi:MAG: MFS transporter [Thermomicrobiales bacterium]|nr:MFS transporter [Thermomicrobiales bacterium]
MADNPLGRPYRVLRHSDYRLLWSAEVLSMIGSQIQKIAVTWQVYELTEDAFKLGLLGLCRFVPVILFGIAGGVMADRGDRRRTLMMAQSLLLLLSMILALLTITGSITLLAIYGITVLTATVEGVSNPTRQALIPLLVPKSEFPAASTMNILAMNVSMVVGPAIGGVILATLGVGAAYLVDAFSFTAVIASVLLMKTRPPRIHVSMGGFAAAIEGLRFLRTTPVLLGVMGADFVATLFGACTTLMPIFADDILDVGPRGLGLLLSAPAAGAVIVASSLSLFRLPDRAGRGIMASIVVYGACLVGFGLSRNFALSLLLLAGSGAADVLSATLRHAARNLLTPDELRGRVASVHRTLAGGGPQLGDFRAGVAASMIGAGPAVAIGGLATVLSAMAISAVLPAISRYRFSDPAEPRSVAGPEPTVESAGS